MGILYEDIFTSMKISDWILLVIRNDLDQFVEKIKTNILCSTTFFLKRAVYAMISKNLVEPGRPQVTVWRMRLACLITRATCAQEHTCACAPTPTHALIVFPRQKRFRDRA
jgi:hypothetical protein